MLLCSIIAIHTKFSHGYTDAHTQVATCMQALQTLHTATIHIIASCGDM